MSRINLRQVFIRFQFAGRYQDIFAQLLVLFLESTLTLNKYIIDLENRERKKKWEKSVLCLFGRIV